MIFVTSAPKSEAISLNCLSATSKFSEDFLDENVETGETITFLKASVSEPQRGWIDLELRFSLLAEARRPLCIRKKNL
jgi:hypothetical protein